jgi:MYXO-CTERM domain-containing protein
MDIAVGQPIVLYGFVAVVIVGAIWLIRRRR